MADSDGFQLVTKKGKKRQRNFRNVDHTSIRTDLTDEFDFTVFKRKLDNCVQEIRLSEFFEATYQIIIDSISKVTEGRLPLESKCTKQDAIRSDIATRERNHMDLLSYGIGNFTTCPIARYQLSFLIVLREKLADVCASCSVYDPMFSKHELEVLDRIDFSVIAENEEGKRKCNVPTVAFLPHCGKALYNNFVWKNIASGGGGEDGNLLKKVILIGNSFSKMIERTPHRLLMSTGNYIKYESLHGGGESAFQQLSLGCV